MIVSPAAREDNPTAYWMVRKGEVDELPELLSLPLGDTQ
jgi:hypothetical protein